MSYVKTIWANGDVITAEKLNNMEDGISAAANVFIVEWSHDNSDEHISTRAGDILTAFQNQMVIYAIGSYSEPGGLYGGSLYPMINLMYNPDDSDNNIYMFDFAYKDIVYTFVASDASDNPTLFNMEQKSGALYCNYSNGELDYVYEDIIEAIYHDMRPVILLYPTEGRSANLASLVRTEEESNEYRVFFYDAYSDHMAVFSSSSSTGTLTEEQPQIEV